MSKPITPDEVTSAKSEQMPDAVIDAFNELIAKNCVDGEAVVMQHDVVAAIRGKLECDSARIFKNKWLDVEDIYRRAGWHVTYDKPAFNESYEPRFVFRKKRAPAFGGLPRNYF